MGSVQSRTHLPKRDELWFRTVFALPSDSSSGFACRIRWVSAPLAPSRERHTMYESANFVDSVLPAPDSPEMMSDCEPPPRRALRHASSAIA